MYNYEVGYLGEIVLSAFLHDSEGGRNRGL